MAVNGKQKGNRFEREIANTFSKRFEVYTGKPQSFRRNADSGSFWGGKNKNRKETHDTDHALYGDIICPDNFCFTIECKNYKSPPSFMSFVGKNIKEWDDWIAQARQDAEESGKDFILIIKYNRVDTFCIIDEKFKDLLANFMFGCYYSTMLIRLEDLLASNEEMFFTKG